MRILVHGVVARWHFIVCKLREALELVYLRISNILQVFNHWSFVLSFSPLQGSKMSAAIVYFVSDAIVYFESINNEWLSKEHLHVCSPVVRSSFLLRFRHLEYAVVSYGSTTSCAFNDFEGAGLIESLAEMLIWFLSSHFELTESLLVVVDGVS
jgi:hypothetical protein